MTDYSIYYRRCVNPFRIDRELPQFDLFVSAFNSNSRVLQVFESLRAKRKIWLIHPEYCYSQVEEPTDGELVKPSSRDERDQVEALMAQIGDPENKSLCIDITGFMRHALVFLIAKLARTGIKEVFFVYSEPVAYSKQENTPFTTKTSGTVRPLRGFGGVNSSQGKDHLIISVGYDHNLISEVYNCKDDASVYPIFAFPSLSADMYQQSATRAAESGAVATGIDWITNRRFAPANDPFSTAGELKKLINEIRLSDPSANIYLSPLSTKAQTLGFAFYFELEGRHLKPGGMSILLPECTTYSRETSSGFKRLWLYTVEFS